MNRSGIVMQSTGSSYLITDNSTGEIVDSSIRGKLRLKGFWTTNPVAVGDCVDYSVSEDGTSVITNIHPRRNYIIRRSPNLSRESHIIASNIDQAFLIATLFLPETNTEFIDRFLVTCQAYDVPVRIILNKSDMASRVPGAIEEFVSVYEGAGYEVLPVSAAEGTGMDYLESLAMGKTTLLSGNSGVGKSSIIRRLIPGVEIRTAEISDSHHKGRHTTTFSTMYSLPRGGYIIDTPGIKGFGLLDIGEKELYRYFPEMMKDSAQCQFYNCTHTHEPGCAIKVMVQEGIISESRYVSYIKILEEDEKYRK